MLEQFRGRCSFRVYIKLKAAKYGIKIYAFVDAINFYLFKLQFYAGQQRNWAFVLSNYPPDVVKHLITPISETDRNVTIYNCFPSVPLTKSILEDNNIAMIAK